MARSMRCARRRRNDPRALAPQRPRRAPRASLSSGSVSPATEVTEHATRAIVVHGGAGNRDAAHEPARAAAVDAAAVAGFAVLAAGGSSLDAVAVAVTRLEDDPLFNAGLGSVLTDEGTVELDASI